MYSILTRIISNSAALYLASLLVSGFSAGNTWIEHLIAGAVLGVLNITVKPILKVVSFPLMMLTLGLFTLVINAALLWALDYLFVFVSIESLMALIWATLVVAAVNLVISHKL